MEFAISERISKVALSFQLEKPLRFLSEFANKFGWVFGLNTLIL